MTISPWRATAIQMPSQIAAKAPDAAGARAIVDENIRTAIRMIEAACDGPTPPQLVLTPEFGFQGPPHDMFVPDWIARACSPVPGFLTEPLQGLARRRRIFIAGNMFESAADWPGRYFNTCYLIAPSGEVVLRYRRINTAAFPSPHDFMDQYTACYTPAETFPVADTELGRIGMIACGELNVPEVARVMMMQGAEVILHPTNSPRQPAQEAAKIVRAAENMVYIISANVAGGIGFSWDGTVPGGRSHILDYRGATLAYEDDAQPSIAVTGMIDIEALRLARKTDTGLSNPLLRARWEMYRPFFANASFYPPNSFLNQPMTEVAATKPVIAASIDNLVKAGIIAA